jgi:NhaP-type Na+/H+ or K+/H+ antiporter
MEEHVITLAVILIAVAGITAQWIAWRFHIPAILLLTLTGLAVGPGLGWLHPSAAFGPILEPLISVFVAIVLFEGGMSLHVYEIKEAGTGVNRLVTVGVPISWLLGAAAAHAIGGLSWPVATLFGAISVITGPTVIIPMLRQAKLKRRPASFLKWEGIVIDPLGALLAVLIYEYLVYTGGGAALTQTFASLAMALLSALVAGGGAGLLFGMACRRDYIPEYLKAPVLFAAALGVYGLANAMQREAGLLAATTLGLVLGNTRLPSMTEIRRFKEYVTILLVSGIFILLTANLDPVILTRLDWHSVALLAALIFLVRPAAVLLATVRADMSWRERALVAWVAPRGIVAAAMAGFFGSRLVEQGYADGTLLVPLVFVLIVVTVTLHGTTIGWLARRLDLAVAAQNGVLIVGASQWSVGLAQMLKDMEISVIVADTSWSRLRPARLSGVPVYFGEILSEESDESLEFNEIGYVLAATSNDAYNALVCTHFAHERGHHRVLQLPMQSAEESDPRGLRHSLRGAIAFDETEVYGELERRCYTGWHFQKTRFTEDYTYEDHLRDRSAEVMEVLLHREDGDIVFKTPKGKLEPAPGATLITFSPSQAPAQSAVPSRNGAPQPVERASVPDSGSAVKDDAE